MHHQLLLERGVVVGHRSWPPSRAAKALISCSMSSSSSSVRASAVFRAHMLVSTVSSDRGHGHHPRQQQRVQQQHCAARRKISRRTTVAASSSSDDEISPSAVDVERRVRPNATASASASALSSSSTRKNSAVAYRLTRPEVTGSRADEEQRQQHQHHSLRRRVEAGRDEHERSAAATDEDREEEAQSYMGFSEDWEVEMVRFWRRWNQESPHGSRHTVREPDIQRLVCLGRTDAAFTRADAVAAGARKISTLLPDAHVPNMLQREPGIVDLNFARASQSILELQTVLCSSDHCSDVTGILERYPRLLLSDDVRAEVDAAKSKLQALAPECDAQLAVSEYPELIYRIKNYDEYAELPMSIQNIIAETSVHSEAEVFAAEEFNSGWDAWELDNAQADDGLVSGKYSENGLGEGDWLNAAAQSESAEWMLDGYWEESSEELGSKKI